MDKVENQDHREFRDPQALRANRGYVENQGSKETGAPKEKANQDCRDLLEIMENLELRV